MLISLWTQNVKVSYHRSEGCRDTESVCSADMSFSSVVALNCAQVGTTSALEESSSVQVTVAELAGVHEATQDHAFFFFHTETITFKVV